MSGETAATGRRGRALVVDPKIIFADEPTEIGFPHIRGSDGTDAAGREKAGENIGYGNS